MNSNIMVMFGEETKRASIASIFVGVVSILIPLIMQVKTRFKVIMPIIGICCIIFGIYAFVASRRYFQYDENGFIFISGLGVKRSYSYSNIEAVYNYDISNERFRSTGIKLIMNDGKKYDISHKLPNAGDMITIIKKSIDKDKIYRDVCDYKNNIKEL